MFCHPYLLDQAASDFHIFHSQQNALNDKEFSQEHQVKTLVENLLSLKPAEFNLRWINKLLDKWQKVVQNNGEYTSDWN